LNGFDYIGPYVQKDGVIFYQSHHSNVLTIFKMKTSKIWKTYEEIDSIEATWFSKCYNGALVYCKPGQYESFGYDFNMYYPRILGEKKFSDLKIPKKQGTQSTLNCIDIENVQYGLYRVNIKCDNKNISKVFKFSEHHVYTHYSLKFAYELIRKHNFQIDIDLIQDGEPNAYLYRDEDLTCCIALCKRWFKCVYYLKKKYPKNILVKMISSSIWGHLTESKTICVDSDKIDEYDVDIGIDADYQILDIIKKQDGSEYYELLNTKHPYKYPMRLKPFITSYGRNKTARVALRMIDNVIRIHTDGICFDRKYSFNSTHFVPDKKYTGLIKFNSIKDYQYLESVP
jgi:hypothetical protein